MDMTSFWKDLYENELDRCCELAQLNVKVRNQVGEYSDYIDYLQRLLTEANINYTPYKGDF